MEPCHEFHGDGIVLVGKPATDAFNRASPAFSVFDAVLTYVVGRGDIAVATGTYKVNGPAGKDAAAGIRHQ